MAKPQNEMWASILAHLRKHTPSLCRHWFDDIEPIDLNGGTLRLLVHEQVQLKYLQRHCVQSFSEAAREATGHMIFVRFIGDDEVEAVPSHGPRRDVGVTTLNPDEEMILSPDYTFDQFVVGPNNQLAHAAANAVARKPGRAYNPFFIYGGHGLGKTHLLQAICQQAMSLHNPMRIYYISCDGFMTQFMEAVQEGNMREFRHRFRNVDMLVIDDIHDLSKRGQTQEEFFHTFNALYQAGKQLVLSSDAPPDQIPDLEERLSSRFNSGLVASILKPSFETRVAILKTKARLHGLQLSDEVASYISARIDTNIRELEGRLKSLQHVASIRERPIDLELAKEVLEEFGVVQNEQRDPPIHQIMDEISRYYGVKLSDLLSKRRQKSIAGPRQVGMWLARQYTRHSLEEIGSYFGGRDHTTVMHAVKSIDTKQADDPSLRHDVTQLQSRLRSRETTRQPTGSES